MTALYVIGSMMVAGGVIYGLYAAGVETLWLVIAGLIIVGCGIMGAAANTRTTRVKKVETTAE